MNTRVFANITLNYSEKRFAEVIAKAVNPDNVSAPKGLVIRTIRNNASLRIFIHVENSVETLFSTIDDLLSCVQVAEEAIMWLRKLER